MSSHNASSPKQEPALVGIETCLKTVFTDPATRPSKRTFLDWKAKKYFPSLKIGKRVFLDPMQVREALEKRFTIEEATNTTH
jgi:hypothetical protein